MQDDSSIEVRSRGSADAWAGDRGSQHPRVDQLLPLARAFAGGGHRGLSSADRSAQSASQCLRHDNGRHRTSGGPRRRAAMAPRRGGPAARRPVLGEGHLADRRCAHDLRIAVVLRCRPERGRRSRACGQACRCNPARQDQYTDARLDCGDPQQAVRGDPQSLATGRDRRRLERRCRRGRAGRPHAPEHRHRRRRLAAGSRGLHRDGRIQAQLRPGSELSHRAQLGPAAHRLDRP